MKTLIGIMVAALVAVGLSSNAGAQDDQKSNGMTGPMTDILADPGSRSVMMNHIAEDPAMRQEMMQKMMQSADKASEMEMHQMMNDPEMRARMQKHVEMMQGMLDADVDDQKKMQEMMNDPEMKAMMQMHMKCRQMMDGEIMEKPTGAGEEDHTNHGGSN